jgi:hypothetical protein
MKLALFGSAAGLLVGTPHISSWIPSKRFWSPPPGKATWNATVLAKVW